MSNAAGCQPQCVSWATLIRLNGLFARSKQKCLDESAQKASSWRLGPRVWTASSAEMSASDSSFSVLTVILRKERIAVLLKKKTQTFWICLRITSLFLSPQDDHKLTLDELHRKYGTDLTRVSVQHFVCVCYHACWCVCVFVCGPLRDSPSLFNWLSLSISLIA